jgi:hypothetical protein
VKRISFIFIHALLILFLQNCSERADTQITEKEPVSFEEANSFLTFINTQASLGPGEYQLVVATQSGNQRGDYSVRVQVNGEPSELKGSWTPSAGMDPDPDNNPSHSISLSFAGGLSTQTNSIIDSYLYLLKNGIIISEGEEINLPISQINSQAYTDAYYRAVDPNNERSTLRDWQRVNGFDKGHDVHVVFRDTKDLGYGRNMFVRKDKPTSNISFYVKNYAADLGDSSGQYNQANVTAAINEMQQYHIGTNAIEFSPLDGEGEDSQKVLKFFTFRRDPYGSVEHRKDTANLDGRGEKQMPIPCLVCHGARLLPLNEDGEFQILSLESAKLNQLEVESFEFAESGVYQKSEIESKIKIVNEYVNEVYTAIGNRESTNFNRWESDFALELSEGRYGGMAFSSDTYIDTFIPTGWKQNVTRPDGVEQLFTEVIQPHCVSCHSIRGKTVAELNQVVNDINFSSYEKFISYNDKLIDYVYQRGIMPLSLLNFNAFWEEPDGAPALLASFLTGFDLYDEDNLPVLPGRPYAKPGENRSAWSPVQLNASASLFASSFQWRLINQPALSNASFNDEQIPNPIFTTDTNGNYVLELTVGNKLGAHSQRTTITIDDTGYMLPKHQGELTFVDDIMEPIMGASSMLPNECANCHRSREEHLNGNPSYDGKYDGIPVFYTRYNDALQADLNLNLYRQVRARANLPDPENSLLLRKPTGNHHGGGVKIDRNTLAGERNYQIFLNWIREGAICGIDSICQ